MTIPFTKQGYLELKKQLEKEISKRPDAVKALSRGREMGDLSENGLYKAAKQELTDIDREIRHLTNLVKYGKIFTPQNNDFVQIGHIVKVQTGIQNKEFMIVGEYEANPKENRISNKSPIGHNLMGRKVGETVEINTPQGKIKYQILKIAKE